MASTNLIRLLLVEDNATLRAAMKAGLEETGKVTVVAETDRGEEAIGLALADTPDAILMDVQLADAINGVQAAVAIRREVARVPVVFYSIQDDERYYRDFLASRHPDALCLCPQEQLFAARDGRAAAA